MHHNEPDALARLELDFETDGVRVFDEGDFDEPSGATSGDNSIAFTLNADGSDSIDVDDTEIVAYRLSDDNELQIWKKNADDEWNWRTIAENISNLTFVYRDADDNTVDLSTGSAGERRLKADSVRSVDIIIQAEIDQGNPMLDAGKTLRTVSARVQCRNLGLERNI